MLRSSAHPHAQDVSELLFECYLNAHGLTNWEHEPQIADERHRPDYRLRLGSSELIFEVKEFRRDLKRRIPPVIAYDPCVLIREKIHAAKRKFQHLQEYCCSLVLFNLDALPVSISDPKTVLGAMLGDLGLTFPVNTISGAAVDAGSWGFLSSGNMIDHRQERRNLAISAIVALDHFALARRRGEAAVVHESIAQEANPKGMDACMATGRKQRTGESAAGDCLREPHALRPLTRELFTGAYDERFGLKDEHIGRVFAGTGIQELEAVPESENEP